MGRDSVLPQCPHCYKHCASVQRHIKYCPIINKNINRTSIQLVGANPLVILPSTETTTPAVYDNNTHKPVNSLRSMENIQIVTFTPLPPTAAVEQTKQPHIGAYLAEDATVDTTLPTQMDFHFPIIQTPSNVDSQNDQESACNSSQQSTQSINEACDSQYCHNESGIFDNPWSMCNDNNINNNKSNIPGDEYNNLDAIHNQNIVLPIDHAEYHRELSPGFVSIFRIYQILTNARVPFYLHDKLIKTIGKEIVQNDFDPFNPDYQRKAFIKELCRKFKSPPPQVHTIHLESHLNNEDHSEDRLLRDTTEVICFDFVQQFRDLLSDTSLFGEMDNLVINKSDHDENIKWSPYINESGTVFEVLDGKWYQQYVVPTITDTHTQFAIPIGLYIDASETVTYQRYSFQPLLMFPLILNVKARNKPTSCRVIALIPDLEAKSSAVKESSKSSNAKMGMAIRNYHKCLEVALSSYKNAQEQGGINCFVRLGNDIRYKTCKIPLAFVLGDAKSQDTLCGRYGGHNTPRLCRACDIKFEMADNTTVQCQYLESHIFSNDVDTYLDNNKDPSVRASAFQRLHAMSQHAVKNAFHSIDMCNNPRGIYGATPHDPMHLFLEGILKYCTKIFVNFYTSKEKALIDLYVDKLFGNLRSSEKRNMLRTNFTKGMTNLTMLTADEQAGVALTILIIGQMDHGREILSHTFPEEITDVVDCLLEQNTQCSDDDSVNNTKHGRVIPKCSYEDFLQVLEMLLSFHAWYKSNTPIIWRHNSKNILRNSIATMLNAIKKVLPRNSGYGWRIQKFHEHLHLVEDIDMFGSPKNFDTGIWENRLIYVGKQHASSIQKRGPKVFTRQLGKRIHERQCAEKCAAYLSVFHNYVDNEITYNNDIDDITVNSEPETTSWLKPKPDYIVSKVINAMHYQWCSANHCNVSPLLIRYIESAILTQAKVSINIWCELKIKSTVYRAHPNYRGGGNWYDYCVVSHAITKTDSAKQRSDELHQIIPAYPPGYYPAKVLGFYQDDRGEWRAIIHSCKKRKDSSEDSCLTERWYLSYERKKVRKKWLNSNGDVEQQSLTDLVYVQQPVLANVKCSQIKDRIFVVEENPGFVESIEADQSALVVHVKKRNKWPIYFTDFTVGQP
jgi:hypothetical protein